MEIVAWDQAVGARGWQGVHSLHRRRFPSESLLPNYGTWLACVQTSPCTQAKLGGCEFPQVNIRLSFVLFSVM